MTPNASRAPSRKHSLSHHASTPSLPNLRRQQSGDATHTPPGLEFTSSRLRRDNQRSRGNSGDSLKTLGAASASGSINDSARPEPEGHPAGGRHGRAGRFGSTAISGSHPHSGDKERKKGFLGGLLKRKTGPSVPARAGELSIKTGARAHVPEESIVDLNPAFERERTSSGSYASSSHSQSHASTQHRQDNQEESSTRRVQPSHGPAPISPSSNTSNALVAPPEEEPEMTLDLDLTDMEGIVDTSIAAVPPSAASTASTAMRTDPLHGSIYTSEASMSIPTTISTGSNYGSAGSASGNEHPIKRSLVSHAEGPQNPFSPANPFSASAINSSFSSDTSAGKPNTPPSPHTLSPKHVLPPTTQPRRPSQLRNMNLGLAATGTDTDVQPLAPAWEAGPSESTVFNTDPFGTGINRPNRPTGLVMTPPVRAFTPQGLMTSPDVGPYSAVSPTGTYSSSQYFPNVPLDGSKLHPAGIASLSAAVNAAWAAPESWGVEGDEDEDQSTEEDDLDAAYIEELESPEIDPKPEQDLPPSTSPDVKPKPPPFGYKSRGSKAAAGSRPGTSTNTKTARPPTGTARPGTNNGRPGTANSAIAAVQVSLRVSSTSADVTAYAAYLPRRWLLHYQSVATRNDHVRDHPCLVRKGRWRENRNEALHQGARAGSACPVFTCQRLTF